MSTSTEIEKLADELLQHLEKKHPKVIREQHIAIALCLLAKLAVDKGWKPAQAAVYARDWVEGELRDRKARRKAEKV